MKIDWPSVVAIIIAILGISVLLYAIFYFSRKSQNKYSRKAEDNSKVIRNKTEGTCLTKAISARGFQCDYAREFSLSELKAATRNFSEDYLLGSGGFGTVYRAKLKSGETVALKRANQESVQGSNEFQTEVELLSKIHSKHLVNLVGFCSEAHEQILVYEFIPNGSLLEHLSGAREPLSWRQRITVAIGAAKGLSYLHEGCNPPIIHRDVKPSNILLDYNSEAKVSDFGLSKHGPLGDETHVSTLVKGTFGYLDPHYYLSLHLTTSSDVYSFGVILLQLVTARPAVDHTRKRSQYNIISWAAASIENGHLKDVIDPFLAEHGYDHDAILHMAKLGLRCTCRDIKLRPSISFISRELEAALLNHDRKMRKTVDHRIPPLHTYQSPELMFSEYVSTISV